MRRMLPLLFVLALGACKTGDEFARPTSTNVTLGVTTTEDVIRQFGDPGERSDGVAPKPTAEQLAAPRSPFDGVPVEGAITRFSYHQNYKGWSSVTNKGAFFIFWQGKLVVHEFVSDYADSSTRFDETKINQIKRGVTTKEQVIALLGEPAGRSIYPAIRDPGNLELGYFFVAINNGEFLQPKNEMTIYNLDVLVGPDGKVIDYQYMQEPRDRPRPPAPVFMPIFIPS